MPTLNCLPSREIQLTRRLSLEETFELANTARRKSSSEASRNDLRLFVGHNKTLELLLQDIAIRSPPSSPPASPTQTAAEHVMWSSDEISKVFRYEEPSRDMLEDEYDDGAEDLEGLALCRTVTRRPKP